MFETIFETDSACHMIDRILQPFLPLIPSYVKDSVDVLNKLPEHVCEETVLITSDVEGLYNNIRHDLGLAAISYWLNKYPDLLGRMPVKFVLEAIYIGK